MVSVLLYGCEAWTLLAEDERRIQAFEFKCLRKLMGITYLERKTKWLCPGQVHQLGRPPWPSAGHCEEVETPVVWPCDAPQYPFQDHPPGHSGRWTPPRASKEELDRQPEGVDWQALATTPQDSSRYKSVEGTVCYLFPHVSPTAESVKGLNEMNEWNILYIQIHNLIKISIYA